MECHIFSAFFRINTTNNVWGIGSFLMVIIYFFKKYRSHDLVRTDSVIKFIWGNFMNMMEIFIKPGSVILGVTLYKPYFIWEKCKFLCILFGPGLNLCFENFQSYRMLFFYPTLFTREIFSQKISGWNIHDAYVAKGLQMNTRMFDTKCTSNPLKPSARPCSKKSMSRQLLNGKVIISDFIIKVKVLFKIWNKIDDA
jgi:hypothetical protein